MLCARSFDLETYASRPMSSWAKRASRAQRRISDSFAQAEPVPVLKSRSGPFADVVVEGRLTWI